MGAICGKEKSASKKVKPSQAPQQQPSSTTVAAARQAPAKAAVQQPQQPQQQQQQPKSAAAAQKEPIQTAQQTGSSGSKSKTINVDKELHKYIIGTKGSTIKQIKEDTNCDVEIPENGETITVRGSSDSDCQRAIDMINKIKGEHKTQSQKDKEHSDMKDDHEKEHQRTEELYKKGQEKVDRIAKERDDLHKQADKAFESGDKSLGHQLREQAKAKTQELEKASKEASKSVFIAKNAKNDKFTVDLHGLHANDAIELLVEHLDGIKSNKGKEFTIITGAGNHSDANGPKIKPMVHKLMKEKGYTYSEVNNGSIVCTL
ncbi:small MutS related family protein [Dictyostelium discoideum AX4]|uniref:Small MutS related family protein n=1 Tax=Dictyostelium discoideum TaxID=44689 RepID=Q54ID5_DICDI|nr:small MutS related family protein [Dictyostelium discoideum AX4]EAL63032.1 small MutS related family protein [Dictyostelium discoideum AX4]|eukprot:XP_636542.1 small MutS related family protein [Dictyostelium discoideum AX4]